MSRGLEHYLADIMSEYEGKMNDARTKEAFRVVQKGPVYKAEVKEIKSERNDKIAHAVASHYRDPVTGRYASQS